MSNNNNDNMGNDNMDLSLDNLSLNDTDDISLSFDNSINSFISLGL